MAEPLEPRLWPKQRQHFLFPCSLGCVFCTQGHAVGAGMEEAKGAVEPGWLPLFSVLHRHLGFWVPAHSALRVAGTRCLSSGRRWLGGGGSKAHLVPWEVKWVLPAWEEGTLRGDVAMLCLVGGCHFFLSSSLSFSCVLLHSVPTISGVQIPHAGSSQRIAQQGAPETPLCRGRAGVTAAPVITRSHAENRNPELSH